jgi:hypothetical protein
MAGLVSELAIKSRETTEEERPGEEDSLPSIKHKHVCQAILFE